MRPREYCCCAIPLVYIGIYATLVEQFVLAIVAGTLSIATPKIVGAATPSFAAALFAVFCYVAAAIQLLGFWAVAKEKEIAYRRYLTLHIMATTIIFALAAAWTVISATRHSTAKTRCEQTFFSGTDITGASATEGQTLCDIFPWVDVGVMGGLWVLLAIAQLYFYLVLSGYGSRQRGDYAKYKTLSGQGLTDDIPMTSRADPWDSRPSGDFFVDRNASGADTLADQNGAMSRDISDKEVSGAYGGYNRSSYPPARDEQSLYSEPPLPNQAYTQDPGPTPLADSDYYANRSGAIGRPPSTQAHPAEGSLGRKTPRIQNSRDFDSSFFATRNS